MIFSVEQGTYAYNKQKELFSDISFTLESGKVLSILGPNGVGKTTLLKCMMGILPWKKGITKIDDKNIKDLNNKQLWRILGYVPQAKGKYSANSVKEMVLLGRSAHLQLFKQPTEKDEEIAIEAMGLVGIEHLENKACNALSGGELQMVLIARALAAKPCILIMDEPESNLDFKNQLIILDTIEKLAREKNITCIINTHYPQHALQVSDKALILSKCGKNYYGDAKDVINEQNMHNAFDVEVAIRDYNINDKIFHYVLPLSYGMKAV